MKKPLIILIAVLMTLAACSKAPEKQPIKIALSIWPGYAHAFIAEEKGFFKDSGVNVELVFTREYADAAKLYKSEKVDGILEVFTDAVFHNSEGVPTKVVYVADYSEGGDVIVARPPVNSLLELKGKPVGIDGLNTFSHMFALSVLKKAGVKEEDMRFEVVSALDVPEALDKGSIFAGHAWEPAKSEALKKGYKVIARAGDIQGVIADVLSFREDIAKARPDDVKAVVRALFKAQDFIRLNRTEAIAIMAKADGMTAEEMESGLNGMILIDKEKNRVMMKKRQNESSCSDPECLFTVGKMIYEFYGNRGRVFVEADLDSIVDPSFLD